MSAGKPNDCSPSASTKTFALDDLKRRPRLHRRSRAVPISPASKHACAMPGFATPRKTAYSARRSDQLSGRTAWIKSLRTRCGARSFSCSSCSSSSSRCSFGAKPLDGLDLRGARRARRLALAGQMEPGPLRGLLVDDAGHQGRGQRRGHLLPQILILFAFIAILEDCGYMARAAYLMDHLMSRCGLNGKSFIPLLSSVACGADCLRHHGGARVIENRARPLGTTILVAAADRVLLSALAAGLSAINRGVSERLCLVGAWAHAIRHVCHRPRGCAAYGVSTEAARLLRGETPVFCVMEMPLYKRSVAAAHLASNSVQSRLDVRPPRRHSDPSQHDLGMGGCLYWPVHRPRWRKLRRAHR